MSDESKETSLLEHIVVIEGNNKKSVDRRALESNLDLMTQVLERQKEQDRITLSYVRSVSEAKDTIGVLRHDKKLAGVEEDKLEEVIAVLAPLTCEHTPGDAIRDIYPQFKTADYGGVVFVSVGNPEHIRGRSDKGVREETLAARSRYQMDTVNIRGERKPKFIAVEGWDEVGHALNRAGIFAKRYGSREDQLTQVGLPAGAIIGVPTDDDAPEVEVDDDINFEYDAGSGAGPEDDGVSHLKRNVLIAGFEHDGADQDFREHFKGPLADVLRSYDFLTTSQDVESQMLLAGTDEYVEALKAKFAEYGGVDRILIGTSTRDAEGNISQVGNLADVIYALHRAAPSAQIGLAVDPDTFSGEIEKLCEEEYSPNPDANLFSITKKFYPDKDSGDSEDVAMAKARGKAVVEMLISPAAKVIDSARKQGVQLPDPTVTEIDISARAFGLGLGVVDVDGESDGAGAGTGSGEAQIAKPAHDAQPLQPAQTAWPVKSEEIGEPAPLDPADFENGTPRGVAGTPAGNQISPAMIGGYVQDDLMVSEEQAPDDYRNYFRFLVKYSRDESSVRRLRKSVADGRFDLGRAHEIVYLHMLGVLGERNMPEIPFETLNHLVRKELPGIIGTEEDNAFGNVKRPLKKNIKNYRDSDQRLRGIVENALWHYADNGMDILRRALPYVADVSTPRPDDSPEVAAAKLETRVPLVNILYGLSHHDLGTAYDLLHQIVQRKDELPPASWRLFLEDVVSRCDTQSWEVAADKSQEILVGYIEGLEKEKEDLSPPKPSVPEGTSLDDGVMTAGTNKGRRAPVHGSRITGEEPTLYAGDLEKMAAAEAMAEARHGVPPPVPGSKSREGGAGTSYTDDDAPDVTDELQAMGDLGVVMPPPVLIDESDGLASLLPPADEEPVVVESEYTVSREDDAVPYTPEPAPEQDSGEAEGVSTESSETPIPDTQKVTVPGDYAAPPAPLAGDAQTPEEAASEVLDQSHKTHKIPGPETRLPETSPDETRVVIESEKDKVKPRKDPTLQGIPPPVVPVATPAQIPGVVAPEAPVALAEESAGPAYDGSAVGDQEPGPGPAPAPVPEMAPPSAATMAGPGELPVPEGTLPPRTLTDTDDIGSAEEAIAQLPEPMSELGEDYEAQDPATGRVAEPVAEDISVADDGGPGYSAPPAPVSGGGPAVSTGDAPSLQQVPSLEDKVKSSTPSVDGDEPSVVVDSSLSGQDDEPAVPDYSTGGNTMSDDGQSQAGEAAPASAPAAETAAPAASAASGAEASPVSAQLAAAQAEVEGAGASGEGDITSLLPKEHEEADTGSGSGAGRTAPPAQVPPAADEPRRRRGIFPYLLAATIGAAAVATPLYFLVKEDVKDSAQSALDALQEHDQEETVAGLSLLNDSKNSSLVERLGDLYGHDKTDGFRMDKDGARRHAELYEEGLSYGMSAEQLGRYEKTRDLEFAVLRAGVNYLKGQNCTPGEGADSSNTPSGVAKVVPADSGDGEAAAPSADEAPAKVSTDSASGAKVVKAGSGGKRRGSKGHHKAGGNQYGAGLPPPPTVPTKLGSGYQGFQPKATPYVKTDLHPIKQPGGKQGTYR